MGHRGPMFFLTFSPTGEDQELNLWDLTFRTLCEELRGHTHSITSLIFTPDSRLVISASMDNSVHLWDNRSTCYSMPAHSSSSKLMCMSTEQMSNILQMQFMACKLLLMSEITQENQEH